MIVVYQPADAFFHRHPRKIQTQPYGLLHQPKVSEQLLGMNLGDLLDRLDFKHQLPFHQNVDSKCTIHRQPVKLDCDEVPTKLTLTVQGDVYGRWSTDALYQQNMSVFELQFSGSNITNEQFVSTMQSFSAKLQALGAKSARRDAGW